MSAKRFKTLSGYVSNISPVKEGKKQHNWAEGLIQTGANTEEKVLFFFEKPKLSSPLYENVMSAFNKKTGVSVTGLSEDKEGSDIFLKAEERKLIVDPSSNSLQESISLVEQVKSKVVRCLSIFKR